MQRAEVRSNDVERTYREHGARLWSALFAYARDRSIADDALSEAFAQLIRRGDEVRDPASWVWTAAFRIAAGDLRERRRVDFEAPDPGYEHEFADHRVLSAIGRLSERQRASILLHYYADQRVKDVARILGTSPTAVGVHLFRARARLKELLGDDV